MPFEPPVAITPRPTSDRNKLPSNSKSVDRRERKAAGEMHLRPPVPQALLRELSPDRPDKTESPYTVDAGHFQLEMDFANFTYNQTDGATTRAWNVAPFNLKAGLLNHVDLQLAFASYVNADSHAAGKITTQSGVGDLATRLKINLWGDDGGQTAFALLPFVTFPTSTDNLGTHAVEGGIILPLAVKLPQDFNLGLETAVSFLRDDDDGDYHEYFKQSEAFLAGFRWEFEGAFVCQLLAELLKFFAEIGDLAGHFEQRL